MITEDYLTAIKVKLLASPAVQDFSIVRERMLFDQGYFRARVTLQNGDFLEVVEFFMVQNQICVTESYRYQWMDESRIQLRKRWDNVKHFPELPNFPHHVHVVEESNVYSSESRNILEIIELIERHFERQSSTIHS